MGVVALSLHLAIVWLGLAALLVYAAPIVVYISYCTHQTSAEIFASAIRIYGSFAAVTIASAGLVFLIGQ
jgi:hypothetical protein